MNSKFVTEKIDQVLRPRGFERKNLIWFRKSEAFDEVIDLQFSREHEKFTFNIGIIDHAAYEIYFGHKLQSPQLDHTWTLKIRIGDILNGKDVWWSTKSEQFPGESSELLINIALPLLRALQTHAAIVQRLEKEAARMRGYPFLLINIAIQRWRMGMRDEARQMLVSLREKTSDAWRVKIDEITRRIV
jgi:hypothetical protein